MGHIYWIASYPKSGNTWMRAFLNHLVAQSDDERGLDRLPQFAPEESSGRLYQPLLDKSIDLASNSELAAIRPRVHAAAANLTAGFLFVKTHSMLARHAGTLTITPEVTAGALYLVRNPLDVVVSYACYSGQGIDAAVAMLNQRGYIMPRMKKRGYIPIGSWSENVLGWSKPNPHVHVMRYEDMLADPVAAFSAAVGFLRIAADGPMIADAAERSSFAALQAEEQRAGFVERPPTAERFFRSGTSGQWRAELTPAQIAAVVVPNSAAMRRHGYWLPEFDTL